MSISLWLARWSFHSHRAVFYEDLAEAVSKAIRSLIALRSWPRALLTNGTSRPRCFSFGLTEWMIVRSRMP